MRYLLDTNVVSDLVRRPQGRVAERVRAVGEADICTRIMVAAELRYGAAKKGSPRLIHGSPCFTRPQRHVARQQRDVTEGHRETPC